MLAFRALRAPGPAIYPVYLFLSCIDHPLPVTPIEQAVLTASPVTLVFDLLWRAPRNLRRGELNIIPMPEGACSVVTFHGARGINYCGKKPGCPCLTTAIWQNIDHQPHIGTSQQPAMVLARQDFKLDHLHRQLTACLSLVDLGSAH